VKWDFQVFCCLITKKASTIDLLNDKTLGNLLKFPLAFPWFIKTPYYVEIFNLKTHPMPLP